MDDDQLGLLDNQGDELEFQNFMLSNAEQELLDGKISAAPSNAPPLTLPPPVQQGSGKGFWNLEYWIQYFDVDTVDVIARMMSALNPTSNFNNLISGNPDLYGPFWVPTTVIFVLFATSTVAESIAKIASNDTNYQIDITMLSFAAGTVYTYITLLPTILYFVGKYYKAEHV